MSAKRTTPLERNAIEFICRVVTTETGASAFVLPTDVESNFYNTAVRGGLSWSREDWDAYLERHKTTREALKRAHMVALDRVTADHLSTDRGKEQVARANNPALMTPQERLTKHQVDAFDNPESAAARLMRSYRELQREVTLSPAPTDAPLFATLKELAPDSCPKTTTELASLINYWCSKVDPEQAKQLVDDWRAKNPDKQGSKMLRDREALDLREDVDLPE